MVERNIAPEEELDAINKQVQERIDSAWQFAEAAPLPAPEEALTDVYVSYP
jgi:pyruvate dehydrogenase E1 component alpha subunit